MKTEPKACAYCGGKINAIEDCDEDGFSKDAWAFHCEDCDLETLVATADYEEAVEAFNRRVGMGPATLKATKALFEQLDYRNRGDLDVVSCMAECLGLSDADVEAFLAEQGAE